MLLAVRYSALADTIGVHATIVPHADGEHYSEALARTNLSTSHS